MAATCNANKWTVFVHTIKISHIRDEMITNAVQCEQRCWQYQQQFQSNFVTAAGTKNGRLLDCYCCSSFIQWFTSNIIMLPCAYLSIILFCSSFEIQLRIRQAGGTSPAQGVTGDRKIFFINFLSLNKMLLLARDVLLIFFYIEARLNSAQSNWKYWFLKSDFLAYYCCCRWQFGIVFLIVFNILCKYEASIQSSDHVTK